MPVLKPDVAPQSATYLEWFITATQRRNLADLDLAVTGPVASEWMDIAQIYAGEPGPGRAPSNARGDQS
ncbi:hypothetical protein HH308_20535 [Gordonia sp. TBRC 11910]|uniref:Uncharacterized protein n=1 Tax=Gordonia asplenii TaxID=2725283 RepID=A0A848KYD6_9ACTN|nr:hypothetical protein [Gordonia asplenii]NMO03606.1 hypothetical protein [Gordonia asplenii]